MMEIKTNQESNGIGNYSMSDSLIFTMKMMISSNIWRQRNSGGNAFYMLAVVD
jgi:hypothetical protein